MYKNEFGIKWPTMVDVPWNQTKPNQTYQLLSKNLALNDLKRVDSP